MLCSPCLHNTCELTDLGEVAVVEACNQHTHAAEAAAQQRTPCFVADGPCTSWRFDIWAHKREHMAKQQTMEETQNREVAAVAACGGNRRLKELLPRS